MIENILISINLFLQHEQLEKKILFEDVREATFLYIYRKFLLKFIEFPLTLHFHDYLNDLPGCVFSYISKSGHGQEVSRIERKETVARAGNSSSGK